MIIAEMGKAKPKVEIDTVFEWVGYDTELDKSAKIIVPCSWLRKLVIAFLYSESVSKYSKVKKENE